MVEKGEKDLKTVNKNLKFFLTLAILCIAALTVFSVYKQLSNTNLKEDHAAEIKEIKKKHGDRLLKVNTNVQNLKLELKQAKSNLEQAQKAAGKTKNDLLKQINQLKAELEKAVLLADEQEAKRLEKLKEWATALAKLETYQEELKKKLKKKTAQLTEWKKKFGHLSVNLQSNQEELGRLNQELKMVGEKNELLKTQITKLQAASEALEKVVKADNEKWAFLVSFVDQYILKALHAKGKIIGQLDFSLGRSRLTKVEYTKLQPVVEALNQIDVNEYEIIIEGHTDLVPHKTEIPLNSTGLSNNRAFGTYADVFRHPDFQNKLLAFFTEGQAHYRKGKRIVVIRQVPRKKFDAIKALENIKSKVKE